MRPLRVHETKTITENVKIATENAFNQHNFGIEGNKKSDKDEKTLF